MKLEWFVCVIRTLQLNDSLRKRVYLLCIPYSSLININIKLILNSNKSKPYKHGLFMTHVKLVYCAFKNSLYCVRYHKTPFNKK